MPQGREALYYEPGAGRAEVRLNWLRKRKRTSWAYCSHCRRDLNGDDESFIEDAVLVRYTCATCGTNSAWDFDTPVPLYVGGWN